MSIFVESLSFPSHSSSERYLTINFLMRIPGPVSLLQMYWVDHCWAQRSPLLSSWTLFHLGDMGHCLGAFVDHIIHNRRLNFFLDLYFFRAFSQFLRFVMVLLLSLCRQRGNLWWIAQVAFSFSSSFNLTSFLGYVSSSQVSGSVLMTNYNLAGMKPS
jgi:hypothetical protein